jgi:hypothetical protein
MSFDDVVVTRSEPDLGLHLIVAVELCGNTRSFGVVLSFYYLQNRARART